MVKPNTLYVAGDVVGFIKLFSKFILVLAIGLSQPVEAQQIKSELPAEQQQASVAPVDVRLEVKSFDSEAQALDEAQNLLAQSNTNAQQTTVMSSDSLEFLQQVGQNSSVHNGRNFLVLNDAISRFTKRSADYIKNSYKNDKIGFAIAVYTTAVEVVMWVHVAPLSTLAMSANIAFTLATAIYFRLNKERWTQVTTQIKTPLRRFFNDIENSSVRKRMLYDFLGNLGLSSALVLMRVPLMSMGQILDHGISLRLFEMPLLMSLAGTISLFTWVEHQGAINRDTHPITKFVFHRVGELRSVLLVTFASTAALLNPATFGLTPWITLSVIGATGMLTYLNSKKIAEWIEGSSLFRRLEPLVRMNSNQNFDGASAGFGGALSCHALFD